MIFEVPLDINKYITLAVHGAAYHVFQMPGKHTFTIWEYSMNRIKWTFMNAHILHEIIGHKLSLSLFSVTIIDFLLNVNL